MNHDVSHSDEPGTGDATASTLDPEAPVEPASAAPPRSRPDGLTIAALTSIALAIALFATWIGLRVFAEDDDAVDVREAVEQADPAAETGSAAGVGDPAPDVRLDMFDGDDRGFAELAGSPVVVNFWASTCAPCLAEMPDFETVHREVGEQVTFLGIDVVDTEAAGLEMIDRTGVTYANARDPKGEVFAAFGGSSLPRTVLVDADGTIVDTHTGSLSAEELRERLDEAGLVQR